MHLVQFHEGILASAANVAVHVSKRHAEVKPIAVESSPEQEAEQESAEEKVAEVSQATKRSKK